jgi:hypothetical protein
LLHSRKAIEGVSRDFSFGFSMVVGGINSHHRFDIKLFDSANTVQKRSQWKQIRDPILDRRCIRFGLAAIGECSPIQQRSGCWIVCRDSRIGQR